MFLNRSRFVSRATIELNRALELSLRFARHPSIETSFFSSLFPSKSVFSFFFLYELYTKYRITDYITIYKRRIYINFDGGRRFETREELIVDILMIASCLRTNSFILGKTGCDVRSSARDSCRERSLCGLGNTFFLGRPSNLIRDVHT